MLGDSSTIPGTEKLTVLCKAHLHTHKKTNDLEVPIQNPLVLLKEAPYCHRSPLDGQSVQWECSYIYSCCTSFSLEESMKRRHSEGLYGKPKDVNKPGMFMQ